jgi:hypothetical protein
VERLDLYEWILGQGMGRMDSSESKLRRIGPAKAQKSNGMEGKKVFLAKIQKKQLDFVKTP